MCFLVVDLSDFSSGFVPVGLGLRECAHLGFTPVYTVFDDVAGQRGEHKL